MAKEENLANTANSSNGVPKMLKSNEQINKKYFVRFMKQM